MNANARVLAYHADSLLISALADRLQPYSITVSGKTRHQEFEKLLRISTHVSGIVVQVDLNRLSLASVYSILTQVTLDSSIPVLLLLSNPHTIPVIQRFQKPNVTMVAGALTEESLARKILDMSLPVRKANVIPQAVPSQVSIAEVLEFCAEVFFTGRILIESADEAGYLDLKGGMLKTVNFRQYSRLDVLHGHLNIQNPVLKLQQQPYCIEDVERHISDKHNGNAISRKDVLIDIFYFMHTELRTLVMPKLLDTVINDAFRRANQVQLKDLFLVYDKNLQEKIQIIGRLTDGHAALLLELYQDIYNSLLHPAETRPFSQFLISLTEIKPYFEKISLQKLKQFEQTG